MYVLKETIAKPKLDSSHVKKLAKWITFPTINKTYTNDPYHCFALHKIFFPLLL